MGADQIEELHARAEGFQRHLDVRNAIKCYEEIVRLVPESSEHLAWSAKLWSDATYLDEIQGQHRETLTKEEKKRMSIIAVERASEALRLDNKASLPESMACLATGRLFLYEGNKSKGRLIEKGLAHARNAVAKGPNDDVAHHLMGRWNWELSQVKAVKRTLARFALRTRLPCTREDDAVASFSTACMLAPDKLVHRVELGRTLYKMGHKERAWRELEMAVLLDEPDINAHLEKAEARALLRHLRPVAKQCQWKMQDS